MQGEKVMSAEGASAVATVGQKRVRVLFVGGLTAQSGGGMGGQGAAAQALARSPITALVDFVPLTSTMDSIPPPSLPVRAAAALKRVMQLVWMLPRVDVALIFSADGLSAIEKGLMCILARISGRGVVVRFSSGRLAQQCDKSRAIRIWLRLTLKCAHAVCSQGPTWTRFFGRFPEAEGKILEIPNGVEMGPVATSENRVPGRIVFVGWMTRQKGIFELLTAFQTVRSNHADAQLLTVGGGPEEASFIAEVERLDLIESVTCLGWKGQDRVREELRKASVFVLPSHNEGLPNAMLEAMAEGTPVIVTKVGSVPDVLSQNHSGILVGAQNPSELAEALSALLSNREDALEMGRRGRDLMRDRYSMEMVWKLYANGIFMAGREAGRLPCKS